MHQFCRVFFFYMIKPKSTKMETREEIASQVDAFLQKKGEIKQIEMGDSGLVDGKYNTSHIGFGQPRQERTPLNHVVAEMQNRQKIKDNTPPVRKKPQKKIVYDDFGEAIRWYWEE